MLGIASYLLKRRHASLLRLIRVHDFVRPLYHVLFHTGMRLGEALALQWSDIELDHHRIVIRRSKSGEGRKVPLRDALARELVAWRSCSQSSQWVFPARNDTGAPMQAIRKGWLRLCRTAGIVNLRPHDLRHNFTSFLQGKWRFGLNHHGNYRAQDPRDAASLFARQ